MPLAFLFAAFQIIFLTNWESAVYNVSKVRKVRQKKNG